MEVPNRRQIDNDAEQLLESVSSRHRRELLRHLGNPPDPQNVPREFWQKVQKETEDELAAILLLMFIASGEFHGANQDEAREQGLLWSGMHSRNISSKYTQSSMDMIREITTDWQNRMDQGEKIPRREMSERLENVFGPRRSRTLASDQVTEAQTAAGEWAVGNSHGRSPDDWWDINPDIVRDGPCPVCAPLHGQPRIVWEGKVSSGPPAHPNCKCTLRYAAIDGPYSPRADGLPVAVGSL